MAALVGRVIRIAAFVFVLPAACLAGMIMYGKALSDAEVAEGTLLSQEEIRARADEAARRFSSMTPAEHLRDALNALDAGYDPSTRTGGDLAHAQRHLAAIPEASPDHARVAALRAEIAARAQRVLWLASWMLGEQLRDHVAVAASDETRRLTRRTELAAALDRLAARGIGCVHVGGGPQRKGLRFDSDRCDQSMLDAIVRPEHLDGLRDFGFVRVRCRNRRGAIDLVPDAGPPFAIPVDAAR